jgi:hypothetical protein
MEASGQHHTLVVLPMWEEPSLPITWEADWAPEPFSTICKREEYLVSAGIQILYHPTTSVITVSATLSWLSLMLNTYVCVCVCIYIYIYIYI